MIEKRHISFRDETTKTEDTNFILNIESYIWKNILIKHKQNLTLFPLVAYAYIYIIYWSYIYKYINIYIYFPRPWKLTRVPEGRIPYHPFDETSHAWCCLNGAPRHQLQIKLQLVPSFGIPGIRIPARDEHSHMKCPNRPNKKVRFILDSNTLNHMNPPSIK